jgi:RimJ/RimL family protein N-acetyltransferase
MNIIQTKRLNLSNLTTGDAAFIYELLNLAGWLKYIGDRNIKTLDDAKNYVLNGPAKSYEANGFGLYLVKLKNENTSVGICGLIKRETLEDVDIGFAFLPQFFGKGYALEAATATLDFAKNKLKLKRVVAITVEYNHKSISLLEKTGMHFEKKIKLPNDEEELMLFAKDL